MTLTEISSKLLKELVVVCGHAHEIPNTNSDVHNFWLIQGVQVWPQVEWVKVPRILASVRQELVDVGWACSMVHFLVEIP
jgi:hypothetical protein